MSRILVIDDQEMIQELIKDRLAVDGHVIDVGSSGEQAVAMISKRRYDLLIIDRNMPGLSGIETLGRLKDVPNAKGMRVLMCTAADTLGDVDDALKAGADDYIVKPIDFKRLSDKVSKLAAASTAPADEPPAGGIKGLMGRLFGG